MITIYNTKGYEILRLVDTHSLVDINLSRTVLQQANLRFRNLSKSNLEWSSFWCADFYEANLSGASLVRADLSGANLSGANLSGADLRDAVLSGAKFDENTTFPDFQIPQDGDLIVWKKLKPDHPLDSIYHGKIAKLLIKKEWRRTASLIGSKCRAERALVLEIRDHQGKFCKTGESIYMNGFTYTVGSVMCPSGFSGAGGFNDDIRIECAAGIHFFMTREEAKLYF